MGTVFGVVPDQFNGFGHDVHRFRAIHGDAVFCFDAKDALLFENCLPVGKLPAPCSAMNLNNMAIAKRL